MSPEMPRLWGKVIVLDINCGFVRDRTTYMPILPSKKPEPARVSRDGEQVFWPIRDNGLSGQSYYNQDGSLFFIDRFL